MVSHALFRWCVGGDTTYQPKDVIAFSLERPGVATDGHDEVIFRLDDFTDVEVDVDIRSVELRRRREPGLGRVLTENRH